MRTRVVVSGLAALCCAATCVVWGATSPAGDDVRRPATWRADMPNSGSGNFVPVQVLGEGDASSIGSGEGIAGLCDVLIVAAADQAWADEVRTQINSTGLVGTVDLFDARSGTPTLAQLQNYGAILTYTDSSYANATAMGDVAADYVDSGGGVVQATFSWHSSIPLAGRWQSGGYSPLTYGSQAQGVTLTLGTVHDPSHPVMDNVSTFNGGSSSYHNDVNYATGSVAIADWSNGRPLAAEMPGFSANIIGLNFYPPSSVARSDFWDTNTDGEWLLGNALFYACGGGPPVERCIYQVNKVKNNANACGVVCDTCPYVRGDLVCTNECPNGGADCRTRLKGFNACGNGAACKVIADLVGCDLPPQNCKRCR